MKAANTIQAPSRHSMLDSENNIEAEAIPFEFNYANKYEEEIRSLTDVIELDPLNANAYFTRATLKVRIGDIDGARIDFRMSEACHRTSDITFPEYPIV